MNKINVWYFQVEYPNGKRDIVAYGDETKYTLEFATEATKKICNERGWTFVGVYEGAIG